MLTPIFDEARTELQRQAYRLVRLYNPNTEKPKPIYRWVYRPEYQFTRYQLQWNPPKESNNSSVRAIDVRNTPPIITSDDVFKLFFDLSTTPYEPLSFFNAGEKKELVFRFGEQEIEATIGIDQQVTFEHPSHLALLTPEDFLTIGIYANNDTANMLWEYAFGTVNMVVDNNHNGKIDASEEGEGTTPDKPFRFWVNNNYDVVTVNGKARLELIRCSDGFFTVENDEIVCEQVDLVSSGASNTDETHLGAIESQKDLDDFAPMLIQIMEEKDSDGYLALSKGKTLVIKSQGVNINVFRGLWVEGTDYLTDKRIASDQSTAYSDYNQDGEPETPYLWALSDGEEREFNNAQLKMLFGRSSTLKLLFEGTAESPDECMTDGSACYLHIMIRQGSRIVSEQKLYLSLYDIKHYYDHYTVGEGILEVPHELTDKHTGDGILYLDILSREDEPEDYLTFVHGWRMQYPERVSFAETMFKRLFWSGYQGRFGFFSWPTGWFEMPSHIYSAVDRVLNYVAGHEQNYGYSEAIARETGKYLDFHLQNLSKDYRLHLVAHSMGNVVASEALRIQGNDTVVENYAPSEAATAAGAYDGSIENMTHRVVGTGSSNFLPDFTCIGEVSAIAAWRCYNIDSFSNNDFDVPPDHYRYALPEQRPRPQFYPQQWQQPYYLRQGNWASRVNVVNFHNRFDAALNAWEFNQLTKPDAGYTFLNDWIAGNDADPTFAYDHQWQYTEACGPICDIISGFDKAQVIDTFTKDDHPLAWQDVVPAAVEAQLILGHVVPSQTNALGQRAVDSIRRNIDLSSSMGLTRSNYDHSAQFYRGYWERQAYWNTLLREFQLKPQTQSEVN